MSQDTPILNNNAFLEFQVKQTAKVSGAKKSLPMALKVLIGAIMVASVVYLTMPQQVGVHLASVKSHKATIKGMNYIFRYEIVEKGKKLPPKTTKTN